MSGTSNNETCSWSCREGVGGEIGIVGALFWVLRRVECGRKWAVEGEVMGLEA